MKDLTKRCEVFYDIGFAIGVLEGILLRVKKKTDKEWIKVAIEKLQSTAEYLKSVD